MAELILNVSLVNPETPREKIQKNKSEKNDISFKDALNKFKQDSKTEISMDKIEKKIENIEKQLATIENNELPKEEIINFIKDIKELLNQLKQSISENSEKKELKANILLTIDSILQMIENLLIKGDFKNLLELIKNNKSELTTVEKNLIKTENTQAFDKTANYNPTESNKNENKANILDQKQIEKINQDNKQTIKNLEPQTQEEVKTINIEKPKKQVETIKEMIFTIDKKIDKQENIIVKNYTPFTSSLNKANLEALINQISGRALVVIKDGKSELKMQLFPPELGRMNMKFVLEDGQLTGKIVVSTKEAFMLFDHNKEQLAQSLNQAGVNVGKIDISLSDFQANGEGDSQNSEKMEKSFFFGEVNNNEETKEDFIRNNLLIDSTINYIV